MYRWVSDHNLVGRRPLLTAAVVFWSAATALAALSTNLASLVRHVTRHVCVLGGSRLTNRPSVRPSILNSSRPAPPRLASPLTTITYHITHKQVGLRSLVGVGEACYVVIATPMIADFFPSKVCWYDILAISFRRKGCGFALGLTHHSIPSPPTGT